MDKKNKQKRSNIEPTSSETKPEERSSPKCNQGRQLVFLSVTVAIVAVLVALVAHTTAIIQVASMRKEFTVMRHQIAGGKLSDFKLGKKFETVSKELQSLTASFENIWTNTKSINKTLQLSTNRVNDQISNENPKVELLRIGEIVNTTQRSVDVKVELATLISDIRGYHLRVPLRCGESYIPTFSGECIQVVTEKKDWASAKASCQDSSGELFMFENRSDVRLVKDFVASDDPIFSDATYFWIGLRTITVDIFTEPSYNSREENLHYPQKIWHIWHTDGKKQNEFPQYHPFWAPGEPKRKNITSCAYLWPKTQHFYAAPCNETHPFICEHKNPY